MLMSKEGESSLRLERDVNRYSCVGAVLRADVDGQILMRAYLSGTPECKFGLNDKLVLQNGGHNMIFNFQQAHQVDQRR